MQSVYCLTVLSVSEEYIIPKFNEKIRDLRPFFMRDQIWRIDRDEEKIPIDEEGGVRIPDVLYCDDLLLFSDKFKRILDKQQIDYIFYKKVVISDETIGIEEIFWLVSVPRIDCIDVEKSGIEPLEDYDYNDGIVPFYNIEKPFIVVSDCGRYEMFRILGSVSDTVFISDSLYEKLKDKKLIGLDFQKYI